MKKEWQILVPDAQLVENLCRDIQCHPAVASILVNRHILSAEHASNFFHTSLNHLSPPFSIKDMDAAVDRIISAILRKEKILIFGDYDVDGITATTLFLKFFRRIGARVSYYIPHRITEGFGLKKHHISDVALPNAINLIITVDCGSDSHDAVAAAKDAGIDIIITDHHMVSGTVPRAVAVVNPKRDLDPSGFGDLAGVGVAFYLLVCLRKKLRDADFWKHRKEPNLKKYLDLVALGTLADMVPLTRENRILTKTGVKLIRSTRRRGLNALIGVCGVDKHAIDAEDIVFYMAPRLNASGRMDHASRAVELLIAEEDQKAREIARSLNHLNQDRRSIENKILSQILDHLKQNPDLLQKNSLVLSDRNWPLGILGIVAARIMKQFYRPVVLVTTADGIGKGSARSIPGINLYKGLFACGDHLETFGGHSMAAGLKIRDENIEPFKTRFEHVVSRMAGPLDFIPKITIDYRLDFTDISDRLIDEFELLKPFGIGNHEPLFMAENIGIASSKQVGGHHRQMVLKQKTGEAEKRFNAIQFNAGSTGFEKNYFEKIAYRLRRNRWNGRKSAQIVVEET
ncbi:MAG: single-stranded-DNA-specific exonuclease RecJ [Desulfobacterales bacterium]